MLYAIGAERGGAAASVGIFSPSPWTIYNPWYWI